MDEALALGAGQDLQSLLLGDVAAHVAADHPFGEVAEAHAVLALDLAGAFAAVGLLLAAGADADGDLVVLVEPVGDVLEVHGFVLGLDGLLDRDDVHADAGAAFRNHLGDARERELGHQVEECEELRMLVRQLVVHDHELGAARHEDRKVPHLDMGRFLAAGHFYHADPA